MAKECLQDTYGPTPCFKIDVKETVCSLSFCPVAEHLGNHPGSDPFQALHRHCVMSDTYGLQTDVERGNGEFVATIARLSAQRKLSV